MCLRAHRAKDCIALIQAVKTAIDNTGRTERHDGLTQPGRAMKRPLIKGRANKRIDR